MIPVFIVGAAAGNLNAKYMLVVDDAINQIDALVEAVLRYLLQRLHDNGVRVAFSGLKHLLSHVMRRSELHAEIGGQNISSNEDIVIGAID